MGKMTFLDKINDIEESEYDGFEEDLIKDKDEEREEEEKNINNEIPPDEIIENNLINWMNTIFANLYLLFNVNYCNLIKFLSRFCYFDFSFRRELLLTTNIHLHM